MPPAALSILPFCQAALGCNYTDRKLQREADRFEGTQILLKCTERETYRKIYVQYKATKEHL